jgi:LmbE family N-acetylglucosaminyl deacetylase
MTTPAAVDLDWGRVDPAALSRIVVLSPHFDDAAMGAGHVLTTYPGSTVVTVLAGRPPAYPARPTPWDASGGFVAGDDVVAARRQEDLEAMTVFGAAEPVWLEFSDHQYLEPDDRPTPDEVAPELAAALRALAPTAVFLPMGLANPDHVVTHEAALIVRAQSSLGPEPVTWFCYEDQGYKHIPGMLAWRTAKLFKAGIWPTPAMVPVQLDTERKQAAIACYRSQIAPLEQEHALSDRMAANVPEQYWRLAPPPSGWERLIDAV